MWGEPGTEGTSRSTGATGGPGGRQVPARARGQVWESLTTCYGSSLVSGDPPGATEPAGAAVSQGLNSPESIRRVLRILSLGPCGPKSPERAWVPGFAIVYLHPVVTDAARGVSCLGLVRLPPVWAEGLGSPEPAGTWRHGSHLWPRSLKVLRTACSLAPRMPPGL